MRINPLLTFLEKIQEGIKIYTVDPILYLRDNKEKMKSYFVKKNVNPFDTGNLI